jgi:hypothetical protein
MWGARYLGRARWTRLARKVRDKDSSGLMTMAVDMCYLVYRQGFIGAFSSHSAILVWFSPTQPAPLSALLILEWRRWGRKKAKARSVVLGFVYFRASQLSNHCQRCTSSTPLPPFPSSMQSHRHLESSVRDARPCCFASWCGASAQPWVGVSGVEPGSIYITT